MVEAGLAVELSYDEFPLVFPTERYLAMVRDRYMSLLSTFDDEEVDAGVEEIRHRYPGGRVEFRRIASPSFWASRHVSGTRRLEAVKQKPRSTENSL